MTTTWLEAIHMALVDYQISTSILLMSFGIVVVGAICSAKSELRDIVAELKELNSFYRSDEATSGLENGTTSLEER